MLKYILLLGILIALSLDSGCKEAKNSTLTNFNESVELIPLKIGNTWVTKVNEFDSTSAITKIETDSSWVSKDTVFDDQQYFMILTQRSIQNGVGSTVTYEFARNTASGFLQGGLMAIFHFFLCLIKKRKQQ